MLRELYTAAMGMLPQQMRLEVTANNMANANTTGYKRVSIFEKSMIDAQSHLQNNPSSIEDADSPVGSYTDFSAGAFQETNNKLDIAIDRKNGFFNVQDEKGNVFFTRDGHFQIAKDGSISTTDGKKLLGDSGPLVIQKDSSDPQHLNDSKDLDINISDHGEVFANGKSSGSIKVAIVDNPESLKRESSSDFSSTDETKTNNLPQEEVSVKQGWLENSNVDVVKEMVQMIELQRMFELGSKVIQTNNETLDQSLKMGRVY